MTTDIWVWGVSRYLTPNRTVRLYEQFCQAIMLAGNVAEFGVGAGDTVWELARYLAAHGFAKIVHGFDSFDGLPPFTEEDGGTPAAMACCEHWYRHTLDEVQTRLAGVSNYQLHSCDIALIEAFDDALCFAHVDTDQYRGTRGALMVCERTIVPGGIIVVDDYGSDWFGVTRAVDEWLAGQVGWHMEAYPRDNQAVLTSVRAHEGVEGAREG